MKRITLLGVFLISISSMQSELTIYDFKARETTDAWVIVNDVVMGGRSTAGLRLNEEGVGVFSGEVSLDNNGGFASMRLRLSPTDVRRFNTVRLKVKSAPARYQFRCKSGWNEPQSYVGYFETRGEWEEVVIDLRSLYPTFRGNRLDMPDFPGEVLAEIAILIGNKQEESFSLEIEKIWLEQ